MREAAMDEIKRSLELAELVHPEYAVLHLGISGQSFNPALFDFAYAAISQIHDFSGLDILIENIANELSTIDRLVDFKTVAALPYIGLCYDSGHAWLQTGKFENDHWKHVRAVHLNDNQGDTDQHLWPFEGTANWPALIEQLVLAKYAGRFTFEVRGNDDFTNGSDAKSRIADLWGEAQNSIEEFRLKYNLSEKTGDPKP
jgi:sugar phosphate isomerase/epimerase